MIELFKADTEDGQRYFACPDIISIPSITSTATYRADDAVTFTHGTANGKEVLDAVEGGTHNMELLTYKQQTGNPILNRLEGRLWLNKHLVSFYGWPSSADMDRVKIMFKQVENIDISNYLLCVQVYWRRKRYILVITVNDYIGLGMNGEMNPRTTDVELDRISSMLKKKENFNTNDWKMHKFGEFYDKNTDNDPIFNLHMLRGESIEKISDIISEAVLSQINKQN